MRNAISTLLLLLVIGCGSDPKAGHTDTIMQAEADAVVALAFAVSIEQQEPSPQPTPTPRPDGRKVICPSCNGTGLSGDKLGACGTCNGDKVIVVEAAAIVDPPKEPVVKTVTLVINDSNYKDWPLRWHKEQSKKMAAAGFTVEYRRDRGSDSKEEAYFLITRGDQETKVVGFHTAEQLLLK